MMNTGIRNGQPISKLLPEGTESGKEFARIIDLLLFSDARRRGKTIELFNDAAGDLYGLDSYEKLPGKKAGIIGYQYKFFTDTLNGNDRKAIKKSLQKAANSHHERKIIIKKVVFVTPEDFTQSATKKGGGDQEWFDSLKEKMELPFEIEHWGHIKLQGLFIDNPSLGFFYYPDLKEEWVYQKKTIQEHRETYNRQMIRKHHKINFVGMSVYKEEAARGVDMEKIYTNDANKTPCVRLK